MHFSASYARVYWAGAALVLLADVAYRQHGSSLDEAVARAWPHRGERATATELLTWLDGAEDGLFRRITAAALDRSAFPDVTAAYAWLGVTVAAGGVTLSDDAPGAATRRDMMNGPAGLASNPARCAVTP